MSSRHAATGSAPGSRRTGPSDEPGVQRITSAAEPHSADLDRRMGRYLWQMGVRTACFIGAFFTSGWVQIVLLIAAIVLPYIAVVLANAGTVSNGEVLAEIPPEPQPALGFGAPGGHGDTRTADPDDGPVAGVVVFPRALPAGGGSHAAEHSSDDFDDDEHQEHTP